MKLLKKAPLFLLLLLSGSFFLFAAVMGRNTVYAEIPYEYADKPVFSLVFQGWKEGIYPWQAVQHFVAKEEEVQDIEIENQNREEFSVHPDVSGTEDPGEEEFVEQELPELAKVPVLEGEKTSVLPEHNEEAGKGNADDIQTTVIPTPEPTPYSIKNIRTEPLRESTREEYLNHISADIYGDAGVLRAAEYAFVPVTEPYFEDALFIGDSRTVGLRDYTDLSDHAKFLCETSLTIQKVFTKSFKGEGTLEEILNANDFGKIYLMLGINELGVGTTEDYMDCYTQVIDRIHELEPNALLFIQANMHVAESKSNEDKIFNNQNIEARNRAIATLADNTQVFYLDVNEVVCDENGYLKEEYTYDQIHLLGRYNDIWKAFLMEKGVVSNGKNNEQ